jgi:hypothetical protein
VLSGDAATGPGQGAELIRQMADALLGVTVLNTDPRGDL